VEKLSQALEDCIKSLESDWKRMILYH
jgi:hypothetical protein